MRTGRQVLVVIFVVAGPAAAAEDAPPARGWVAGAGPAKVAFAPDGKLLAVAAGRTVRLWDPATGEARQTLTEYDRRTKVVAFAPDGGLLATAARLGDGAESGGEVRLWDAATGERKKSLTVEGSDLNALAFAPDSRFLVAGGLKGLWCWDTRTGKLVKHVTPSSAAVLAVAFSPDGRTLASGGFDAQVRLWDPADWAVRRTLDGHRSEIRGVVFASDGKTVASSGMGEVLIWDVDTGRRLQVLKAEASIWAVTYAPRGDLLAGGTGDPSESATGGIKLWDPAAGNVRRAWAAGGGAVVSVAFSPDGKTLAGGSYGGKVTLWNLAK